MILFLPFAFFFGACVGSFLNVLIIRLPLDESIWRRSSHCTSCQKPIPPYDNIPIISYLLLRGRCRTCGTRFSSQYFWVELLTGLFFAATFYFRFAEVVPLLMKGTWPSWHVARAAILPWLADISLLSLLLAMTWIDARHLIIPLEITVPGFIIGFLLLMAYPELRGVDGRLPALAEAGKAVVLGGGLLWLVRWLGSVIFKREAMGMGDVHLMIMLGMFLNWLEVLLVIFLSALIGSAGGITAKFIQRRTHWRFEVPYGPYIAAAAVIAYFWGPRIIHWYLSFYTI